MSGTPSEPPPAPAPKAPPAGAAKTYGSLSRMETAPSKEEEKTLQKTSIRGAEICNDVARTARIGNPVFRELILAAVTFIKETWLEELQRIPEYTEWVKRKEQL